jgi:hypothetical protein
VIQFLLIPAAPSAPKLEDRLCRRIEALGTTLARRKGLAICSIVLATAVLRVSLLPFMPVPVPEVHDEFSHLLAADTFVHGRLANPPHPMSIYLDTFHVNQRPVYVSIYPPAQGAVLALGELLGHPWIGVVLSCAAMCGAIVWMLQGWLPPRWALLGGVLAVLQFGISSYWMNSYWGGAVPALGGALAVGALPRIMRKSHAWDSAVLGIGTAILANSRPFEGLIFCIPVYVALAVWLFRGKSISPTVKLQRVVGPLSLVLLLCGIFVLYYNVRTTGNPTHFAYVDNVRSHFAISQLAWERNQQPVRFSNPQFDVYYNHWWPRVAWQLGRPNNPWHVMLGLIRNAIVIGGFYLWPGLLVALLALPWILRDRQMKLLRIQWAICFAGLVLVAIFVPHYAAPFTATTFALALQGLRHVRRWTSRGAASGVKLSRAVVLCAIAFAPFHKLGNDLHPTLGNRARIETRLDSMPGAQLVVIRYSARHDPHEEWVYNRADIDHAKVIWAREIPGVSMQPLLDYFRDRRVWLVEPDKANPQLVTYSQPVVEAEPRRISSVTKAEDAQGASVHGR